MKIKLSMFFVLFIFSSALIAQEGSKIIIFWYGMGKGHLIPAERIADYVKDTYNKRGERVELRLVDLRDFTISDSKSEEIGKRKYLTWAGKEADSYTRYFEWYLEKEPEKIESNFDLYRLSKYLIREKPKAIITVFWGAAHTFYLLKSLFPDSFKTPVSLLYTDYGVRKYTYMVPTIDKIFFGSKEMVDEVFRKYPPLITYKNNFDFSGIPININRIQELQQADQGAVKSSLGLNPNASIITIARGGEVYLPVAPLIEKTIINFSKMNKEIQVVLLAGKAVRDKKDLDLLANKYGNKVKIVGFIDNEEYLAYIKATDVFITKPGGAGITEAALTGVPLILMKGLGGQEEDNRNEFVRHGLALYEEDENKIIQRAAMILNDPKIRGAMIIKQRTFFKGYDPSKIAEWAYFAKGDSNWNLFREQIEQKESKVQLQKNIALDPITLKNWFFRLNEISLSDISKDQAFKKTFQAKAQIYIKKAINNNKALIEKLKKSITEQGNVKNREYYVNKWKLFRAIILDHSFHINLHATYESPDRALLDPLTKELIQFLDTDIFAKEYEIWEFTKGNLYSFLVNFYYLSRFYPKAQYFADLAFKEFPLDNTSESLINLQGDIFLRLKKPQQAIDFYKFYLSKNPAMETIRFHLAHILDEENKIKEAEKEYITLLQESRFLLENRYFEIASFYLKNNRKDEALNILFTGLGIHKNSISLTALAIRLISSDPVLKKNNEKKLAELIEQYQRLKEVELKKLEDLPLLIED